MVRRSTMLTILIALAFSCRLTVVNAYAAGGVLVDDLKITNDGKMVFSDGFNSAALSAWSKLYDATLIPSAGGYYLHLNKHHSQSASMYHQLSVKQVGVLELSAKVFINPPEEQYLYGRKQISMLVFTLYSANAPNTLRAAVSLYPGEKANRVGIGLQRTETGTALMHMPKQIAERLKPGTQAMETKYLKGYGITTPKPVIQPKTWATVTVRMDSKTGTATILVDGKEIVSQNYDVNTYGSLGYVMIDCSYGDGAKIAK